MWVAQVLSAVGLFRDLSWSLSCPVYCGGSQVLFFGLGFAVGLISGLVLSFCALRALGLCLAPDLWNHLFDLSAGRPAFRDICMSDRVSSQDITNLTAAVRDLALAIRPATGETESSLSDWELLGEEFTDCRAAADPDCQAVGRRHLEEGPGPLPGYCLDLACRKLSLSLHAGPLVRADRAFFAGFFANKAVECHCPYRPETPLQGLHVCHQVNLRRSEFSGPVRFTSRADFERAVRSDDQAVFESFASQTELEIFCIGANCPVSSLGVWKSRQSSVSRRGNQASSSGMRPQN